MENRIILITGPKHSGKSLSARALGEKTGGEVFDLDEIIKKETGKSPRELFLEGTMIFKKAEAMALERLLAEMEGNSQPHSNPKIIASGGGLIDNGDAMELIYRHEEIVFVYLDISAETAWQRILKTVSVDGELPPFLRTENPRETHLALHRRRAEAYKALGGIIVASENKTPEEIAGEIFNTFKKDNNEDF